MKYALTFSSLSAYTTAKASGGSIYNILNGSDYSAAVVSFITATGNSCTDSVNIIVPRESGQVGDMLIYSSSKGFEWAKGGYGSTTSVGSNTISQSKLTSAGYACVGWCIHKEGSDCLIASLADLSTAKWSETQVVVPGVTTYSSIKRNDGDSAWIAGGNMKVAESYFGTSYNQYVWPVNRTQWADGVTAGTLTYTGTEGSVTINPANYDNIMERWYRHKIALQFPSASGCMKDFKGKKNTAALISYYGSGSTYAFQKAYAHAVSVTGFTAGNWWLPSIVELWYILKNKILLRRCGMPITESWYWSSTQYSATTAWYVNMTNSYVHTTGKSNPAYVRAVAAFKI